MTHMLEITEEFFFRFAKSTSDKNSNFSLRRPDDDQ